MTYTDMSQALYQFFSQFSYDGVPVAAYKQGHVPNDAPFPYFTFRVSMGDFNGTSFPAAFLWCKHSPGINVNAQRAAILDMVATQIPPVVGRMYRAHNGGAMWIKRNEDFLSDYEPPDDTDESATDEGEPVIGARIALAVTTF